ncbi:MAG TPA: PD-(D/E)XK nuclease family protein, partial [Gemmatimonadales bacterium]
ARGVRRAASRPRSRGTWALDSDHPHNWKLETGNRPIRFGEKDSKERLLDLAGRMLDLLHRHQEPGTEILGVEQPFDVPLIDLDTGEVLHRAVVGTLDLIERDAEGRIVVVDLKTSARKYTDLQVKASLQLSLPASLASALCVRQVPAVQTDHDDDVRFRYHVR